MRPGILGERRDLRRKDRGKGGLPSSMPGTNISAILGKSDTKRSVRIGHRSTVIVSEPGRVSDLDKIEMSVVGGDYAVLLPYATRQAWRLPNNLLKSLALPRGLEPLFSP